MSFLGGIMKDVITENTYATFENMGDFFSPDSAWMLQGIGTSIQEGLWMPGFDMIAGAGDLTIDEKVDLLGDQVGDDNVNQSIDADGDAQIHVNVPGTETTMTFDTGSGTWDRANPNDPIYYDLPQVNPFIIIDPHNPTSGWVIA